MEKHFYAPMLRGEPLLNGDGWQETLAADYMRPHHHISMVTAIGRRLRRSYVWILGIQAVAYYGKIAIDEPSVFAVPGLGSSSVFSP